MIRKAYKNKYARAYLGGCNSLSREAKLDTSTRSEDEEVTSTSPRRLEASSCLS